MAHRSPRSCVDKLCNARLQLDHRRDATAGAGNVISANGVNAPLIQDERAREYIRLLLNLVETLTVELRKAQAENRYLRKQLHGRKGGGGKPDPPKGASSPGSRFSEKERAEPPESKQSNKCSKLDRIPIDREQGAEVGPGDTAAGRGVQRL